MILQLVHASTHPTSLSHGDGRLGRYTAFCLREGPLLKGTMYLRVTWVLTFHLGHQLGTIHLGHRLVVMGPTRLPYPLPLSVGGLGGG